MPCCRFSSVQSSEPQLNELQLCTLETKKRHPIPDTKEQDHQDHQHHRHRHHHHQQHHHQYHPTATLNSHFHLTHSQHYNYDEEAVLRL
uniref:Uncharacterized protein n=1 Tax=Anguilla anguilla TaxID=7936 RepID=A0A0E9XH05_ANGAN